jgi:hypothetical protein
MSCSRFAGRRYKNFGISPCVLLVQSIEEKDLLASLHVRFSCLSKTHSLSLCEEHGKITATSPCSEIPLGIHMLLRPAIRVYKSSSSALFSFYYHTALIRYSEILSEQLHVRLARCDATNHRVRHDSCPLSSSQIQNTTFRRHVGTLPENTANSSKAKASRHCVMPSCLRGTV